MTQAAKILIVEDEEHLAVGIKFNLEAEGYTVTAKGDGPTAMEFLEANRDSIDLVILDLMLPGMSGYEVCESMRMNDHLMPVLILSARTEPEDRSRGFDAGADQYLTKPFELDELLSRVKNLLARRERTLQQAADEPKLDNFEFAGHLVNFETHEATVGGDQLKLTQLELKLLKYFIQNEGRVIPRGELLVEVWDMPASLNTRAPDQIIRRLRKTFESDAANPRHFITIRDAGYRFLAEPDSDEAREL
ncbi:MAG: response regulator transcription factor [Planctomycetota bacterium]